jgi:epoxyqueuosine reductase
MTGLSSDHILQKARQLGADAVGVASVEQLRGSPSHGLLRKFGTMIDGEYAYDEADDLKEVAWPPDVRSAVVVAVSHPRDRPELDWSCASGQTLGNRRLVQITDDLAAWAQEEVGVRAYPMPYWVEHGGVLLKDAAVLAGLGCVGRNNLLVTPERGPRIRLRAVLLDEELAPAGPIEFDPCAGCDEPCRAVCPQQAFGREAVSAADAGQKALPGRDGTFGRAACFVQMGRDHEDSGVQTTEDFLVDLPLSGAALQDEFTAEGRIKWCRRCELACPIGE